MYVHIWMVGSTKDRVLFLCPSIIFKVLLCDPLAIQHSPLNRCLGPCVEIEAGQARGRTRNRASCVASFARKSPFPSSTVLPREPGF